jgi:hypothetical protein
MEKVFKSELCTGPKGSQRPNPPGWSGLAWPGQHGPQMPPGRPSLRGQARRGACAGARLGTAQCSECARRAHVALYHGVANGDDMGPDNDKVFTERFTKIGCTHRARCPDGGSLNRGGGVVEWGPTEGFDTAPLRSC